MRAPPEARVGLVVGVAVAVLVAAGYGLALAIPALGGAFLDTRYDVRLHTAVWISAVDIPLSTVLLEEIAFRGVVWGLVAVERGAVVATLVSSVLFGLWHVLPALDLARTSTAIGGGGLSRRRSMMVVAGTVLGTAAAGLLLAQLRAFTGSVLAPAVVHWAANGIGVLASAWMWRRRAGRGSPARDEVAPGAGQDADRVPRQGRWS